MVEAALVFPLVILTVVAVIQMLLFFYQLVETEANMHMALRVESGRISETSECAPQIKTKFPVYQRGTEVYFLGNMAFMDRGILKSLEKQLSARKYVDHEADFVRIVDLVNQKEQSHDE